MAWAGEHRDSTPPRVVTGTSCGDLLAAKYRELCFPEKKTTVLQKKQATRFGVSGSTVSWRRIIGLSLPRRLWPLRPSPSLSLLFRLKGLLHHATNLLLHIVVVGGELALDFGRLPFHSNGCHQLFLC